MTKTNLTDQYTILRNCRKWHKEKIDIVSEEHDKRRHTHEARLLDKRIQEIEKKLGLRER